ncbi:hypothetical protein ACGFZJ_11895 [Streptomyces sp. NPDC048253]|uniref:hypothetical protein n=1 Tax=Streptomyces sp. NPDC048253 TaxID=3365524 RepID=UPI0037223E59
MITTRSRFPGKGADFAEPCHLQSPLLAGPSPKRVLDLQIMDMQTLTSREEGHAWVPERFDHIQGMGCEQAERRTDTQLKGLKHIPGGLVAFLRADSLLADSPECLNALVALKSRTRQGIVPNPTSQILASMP